MRGISILSWIGSTQATTQVKLTCLTWQHGGLGVSKEGQHLRPMMAFGRELTVFGRSDVLG